jgi:hypothetical protein
MTAHTHQTARTQYVKAHANPYEYPQAIRRPTLVINGDHDVIIYTVNSFNTSAPTFN